MRNKSKHRKGPEVESEMRCLRGGGFTCSGYHLQLRHRVLQRLHTFSGLTEGDVLTLVHCSPSSSRNTSSNQRWLQTRLKVKLKLK